MATPTNIELIEPYIIVESGIEQEDTDINLIELYGGMGRALVRSIYTGCTKVAEGDKIFFLNGDFPRFKQDVNEFRVIDVNKVLFKSTYTPVVEP